MGTIDKNNQEGLSEEIITNGLNSDFNENEELPEEQNDTGNLNAFRKRIASSLIDLIDIFCSAIFLMLLLFMFVFKYVTVIGNSMYPTLHDHDKLIITDLFYTPKQGDIIVIDVESEEEPLIKRVIATEGQTVALDTENWRIYVDGVLLDEEYQINKLDEPMAQGDITFPYTVEEGKVFVMGDNRNRSKDSRMLGALDASAILGKVAFRLAPIESIGVVE